MPPLERLPRPLNGLPRGGGSDASHPWGEPDMAVLRQCRRPPPTLPLRVLGPRWERWVTDAADAAACAPDYVVAPVFAAASVLIGHARWAQASPGWAEPPHLWLGTVGDSGSGKSPGADCLAREVLPEIERRMMLDYPDALREWRKSDEFAAAAVERWKVEVRDAHKHDVPPPLPPADDPGPEPPAPRLRQSDVTIERVATLLASAAPKGLLLIRDELAGWIAGMCAYNDGGRAFWIEAYGGRPYRVERQKHPEPIVIPRLALGVYGTTQPERLVPLLREADDGLLSRILWGWPDPVPFRLGQATPNAAWATEALDRLRRLTLRPGSPAEPVMVPLAEPAREMMERFGRTMQDRQTSAGGLYRSALGKARGHALRLALVIEYLWWCAEPVMAELPLVISEPAFAAAATLVEDYYMAMAERVYGDAAATIDDRNAATLARWITRARPAEVDVRELQRHVRLPGLRSASDIHAAAVVLVEADWLQPPAPSTTFGERRRAAYAINPQVFEAPP